jgi:hypothetical protein
VTLTFTFGNFDLLDLTSRRLLHFVLFVLVVRTLLKFSNRFCVCLLLFKTFLILHIFHVFLLGCLGLFCILRLLDFLRVSLASLLLIFLLRLFRFFRRFVIFSLLDSPLDIFLWVLFLLGILVDRRRWRTSFFLIVFELLFFGRLRDGSRSLFRWHSQYQL